MSTLYISLNVIYHIANIRKLSMFIANLYIILIFWPENKTSKGLSTKEDCSLLTVNRQQSTT
jgi:hypothetical protein